MSEEQNFHWEWCGWTGHEADLWYWDVDGGGGVAQSPLSSGGYWDEVGGLP